MYRRERLERKDESKAMGLVCAQKKRPALQYEEEHSRAGMDRTWYVRQRESRRRSRALARREVAFGCRCAGVVRGSVGAVHLELQGPGCGVWVWKLSGEARRSFSSLKRMRLSRENTRSGKR